MRKILLSIVSILLIIVIVEFQSCSFISTFWSNLLSSATITILFGIFIDQFTELTKKPSLRMVIKQGRSYSDRIVLTCREDGNYETSFRIAIRNDGNKMLKPAEGYWHFYLPNAQDVKPDGEAAKFVSSDNDHIRNCIDLPIFPKSFLDVGPEFKITIPKADVETFKVYYFFETNYGYFPKTISMDQNTGLIEFNRMTKIPIKY